MTEIREIISAFERNGDEPLSLATLVRARGSSYRRPGARMLVGLWGTRVGSLSGGCLEDEVVDFAREVMRTKVPRLVAFDTRRRFGCHGAIEILIEPLPRTFLATLAKHQRARRLCFAVTKFGGTERGSWIRDRNFSDIGRPKEEFVQRIEPPIRLIALGRGPDSAALRGFSELLGWDFLEIEGVNELPANLDQRTAAVIKTHNYGRDFAALQKLLPGNLPYVALIGPRKRRDQLLADLFERFGPLNAELFAPAGLNLGSETPEEIALAIVAEIQSVLAGASPASLRQRKAAIHGVNSWLAPEFVLADTR